MSRVCGCQHQGEGEEPRHHYDQSEEDRARETLREWEVKPEGERHGGAQLGRRENTLKKRDKRREDDIRMEAEKDKWRAGKGGTIGKTLRRKERKGERNCISGIIPLR